MESIMNWDPNKAYEIEDILYIIEFRGENPATFVYIHWVHCDIQYTWLDLDDDHALKETLLQGKGNLGREFRKLKNAGAIWIEGVDINEHERQLPPWEFVKQSNGEYVYGFPLEFNKDQLAMLMEAKETEEEEKRRENLNKRRARKGMVIESEDDDEKVEDHLGDKDQVAISPVIVNNDDLVLPLEEEELVKQYESSQAQLERERLEEELNKECLIAIEDRNAFSMIRDAIVQKALEKDINMTDWTISIGFVENKEENPRMIWCQATHSLCKRSIFLWKKTGTDMPAVVDGDLKKFFSMCRLRLAKFSSHVCVRSDEEPTRKSMRTGNSELSVNVIALAIKSTFGFWLFKSDNRTFKEPAYRARHISAAIKWLPFFARNKAVFSNMKVF